MQHSGLFAVCFLGWPLWHCLSVRLPWKKAASIVVASTQRSRVPVLSSQHAPPGVALGATSINL